MGPDEPGGPGPAAEPPASGDGAAQGSSESRPAVDLSLADELKDSYLTYAMSVIVSRALPDVRDGLKPSQRRILVAMNDLNLSPGAARVKCAKIAGDTSGNYHPHGESIVYPTLVRMAQEWNMRHVLIDKQGNFGSIAGLPAAAMRYTEARLSPIAALMLEDLKLDTVDFVPTYDERRREPTVLPSKFPNLLVNGASGIAVGMATSIPPHNLREVCQALIRLIDDPDVSIDELLEVLPGPDFPTGGIICGRSGIRQAYHTGRGGVVLRARADIEEMARGRQRIVIREIPYQKARDELEEQIARLIQEDKITGVTACRNESDLQEPVRLVLELEKNADAEVVLNQLYRYSELQTTFSLNFLALVDGKPRTLNIKELLEEFLRHRTTVIRRRTQHLLTQARQRKHTVEGLLMALADIDRVIHTIRTSASHAEAKTRLMQIDCPAAMLQRALGAAGFAIVEAERGRRDSYTLTAVQAEAILRMTLGSLVNLEQEKLATEHRELLGEIEGYLQILGEPQRIRELIREELQQMADKYADDRRTEISDEEPADVDLAELIAEEAMVVTISQQGYIKRTPAATYRRQRRGGKGIRGASADEDDPISQLFAASTHDYLLFFTNSGRVHWRKVYEIPQLGRESRGRAIVNLLRLAEGERISGCLPVRDFTQTDRYLLMATRRGQLKKTALAEFSRPKRGGIIAIGLREGDELVDVVVAGPGDEIVLATAQGQALRFRQEDVRPMGRQAGGVRGIRLREGDELVGMVVADPEGALLTACVHGYGKRTPFGPNSPLLDGGDGQVPDQEQEEAAEAAGEEADIDAAAEIEDEHAPASEHPHAEGESEGEEATFDAASSAARYPTKRRGGMGVRDIRTTPRNGPVIGIASVQDDDELLMISARGKIQRIRAGEVRLTGRNTQGVRIMTLEEGDTLAAIVRLPRDADGPTVAVAPPPRHAAAPPANEEDELAEASPPQTALDEEE